MQPLWYRDAVIYQLDVALFRDANGDGCGDLRGVTDRLEHIRGLGANCIWLLPFYPSPQRDGGYDVTDHLSVDPQLGDVADFAILLEKADDLGLRVLLDLVAQHTSLDHRWFQEARRDRRSPYRGYYVWADEPHETGVEPMFPPRQQSVWSWDEEAQQFYRHTFYSHEPDLELGNPAVRQEMFRTMAFWLRLGVSGFRVDAAPYMVERARRADPRHDGFWLLEDMREFVTLRRPDAVLLGEVDVPVEGYADYYGDGDRFTMLLDFWLDNHLFLALNRADAEPVRRALVQEPDPGTRGQRATFLRNHDELDLERLTDAERSEVLDGFAPQPSMRAFDRGIRRRLAPMLGGDERRLAMAVALLMSLPGSPVLLYGDEIGMGEDLSRPERQSVRAPMQWSRERNAGFSVADPDRLVAPVIRDGPFGYETTNVYAQTLGRDSLLSKVGHLVRTRTGCPEIGRGRAEVLDVGCDSVLALSHRLDGRELLTMVNLADTPAEVAARGRKPAEFVDILADDEYDGAGQAEQRLRLNGYGYRWLRRRDELFR